MTNVLLVGCGAEIGSMLLGMVEPARDGFTIDAVLTNPVACDPKHPEFTSLDGLCARILLAQPELLDRVKIEENALYINDQRVPVFFGDMRTYSLAALPGRFGVCIVATSKAHINDRPLMERFLAVADYVVGVAEAVSLPGLYPGLIGAPERFLPVKPQPAGDQRIFALGSCQTNGWQAQLRGLLELAEETGMQLLEFRGLEVDIVHPDTPTGQLGTSSLRAREQDPRNNLRPGFSQVEQSMNRLFPNSHNLNGISLRTLVMPPGYQLCRFFFRYLCDDGQRLNSAVIAASLARCAERLPTVLRLAERPYGSRGYERSDAAAVVLPQSAFLRFADDPFGIESALKPPISELILQSYVHNTRGYCRSVIEAVRYLLTGDVARIFAPVQ